MKDVILNAVVFAVLAALFGLAGNDWKLPGSEPPPAAGKELCEHGVPEADCATCRAEGERGGTFTSREGEPGEGECVNTLTRVTLAPAAEKAAGILLHTVEARTIAETIRANAETRHVPARYARVAPRVSGVVREVKAALGQAVEAGTALAVVESADFGQAKADHLQALAVHDLRRQTYEREKDLFEKKISAGRELAEAKTALEEARLGARRSEQRLGALGLSAEAIRSVAETQDTSPLLEVAAPFTGTVLEAAAVIGETAGPDKPLFSVADTEKLWITIDVYEPDLPKIEPEQKVSFTMDGLPGKRFPGRVVATGGEVDDRTRTVPVLAEVKNVDRLLRARMFGRAEIAVRPPEPKLLVPKESVQSDGDCQFVFVATTPGVFKTRGVQLGAAYGAGYEILGGLAAGEKVVTTGSFLLKTEVLRGEIGAGCCPADR